MRGSSSWYAVGMFVAIAVAVACKTDEPKDPPERVKRVELDKIPVPEHTPEMLSDPGKPRRVTATGTITAEVAGRTRHFEHLPKGMNAAVHSEENDVTWVRIHGQASSETGPSLRIELNGKRLDTLKLPATFKTSDDGKAKLEVRYELAPTRYWEASSERDSEAEVTFESFAGRRLKGTFSGTLDPKTEAMGEPLEISEGEFEVELRLNGVEPGEDPVEEEARG